jgi:uncharacterized phage-associated protein
MIEFEYSEKKAMQLSALLLKMNGGRMNYTKLIKLLYIIEREAMRRWDSPVIGDQYVSMANGPVLSRVYKRIKKIESLKC